ncbi:GGDEF domain-containing protein [Catellatospora sp. NPDC049609]|uniref:GGDEF domain-containing protein n=1 Tax=Catellatospora sp. NPDC049609 TaxID=3155505 RepID=UPI00343D7929
MNTALRSLLTTGLALACSAGWAGSLMRRHRLRERWDVEMADARRAATTDPLTGLPNRTALTTELDMLTCDSGWSLALVDVDHFKSVNDTLGHGVGDQVLTTTARRLCDSLPGAVVARLGGDEFAIILPVEPEQAVARLEQAAAAVGRPQPAPGLALRVGLSVGVAAYYTPGLPIADLIRRADTALYQAKETRGRIVAWTPQATPPASWAHERRQARGGGPQRYNTSTDSIDCPRPQVGVC